MEEKDSQYVKRSQKDYSLSFKLSVVSEIEQGKCSITSASQKIWLLLNMHSFESGSLR